MKVLFLNHYAGVFGGVESYVRRAAAGLSERGVECILGRIEDRGEGVDRYLEPFASAFKRSDEAGLAAEAERLAPDVIFLHKLRSVRDFLPLLGKIRIVRYVHDHDLTCPRRHKYYAWNGHACYRAASGFCWLDAGFVERRGRGIGFKPASAFFGELEANRRLDLALVGSRAMRYELVMNGFNPSRVAILPPSTPPAAKAAQILDPQRVKASSILYVGQLIRGKGVDLMLEAAALMLKERPLLRFVVAGSGNADSALRKKARELGIDEAVRFAGQVDDAELEVLYADAALLAVPSRWPEPFGMVGLEAMRHGLPVVGFAVGGIPDWLEDGLTGILAKPGNPRSLANAMARIMDNPALAFAFGEAGRLKAEKEFSFADSMEKLDAYLAGRKP